MSILIAGYPYIRESFLKTFDYYPDKGVFFLLPEIWKAKEGKVVFTPPKRPNIFTTRVFFYHSHYPIIGGLFKGLMPSFPWVLWKLRGKINLVYSPSEPVLLTTLYQGFWAKAFGLKYVVFTWENVPYDKKFTGLNGLIKKIILKINLALSDGLICGSRKSAEIHRKLTGKPIGAIPLSGVDVGLFSPGQVAKVFMEYDLRDKVVFTFVGAIGKRKGIHNIIKAFPGVIEKVPNARLVIAGSGEYEEEIKKIINELDLGDSVIVIPWVSHSELIKLLSASDVFLYPSLAYGGWEEQFGYSMAEASLMEVPVISTFSGSIEEVVLNGKTGILVKPDDVDDLRSAMIKLAADPILRKELGRNGRRYISENFRYEIVAKKFYDFFKNYGIYNG